MEKLFQKSLRIRLPIVIVLLIPLLLLGGCMGKRDVEELAFVMGMGLDLGKEPGTYQVTYQIAQPKASGGSAAELKNWTVSIEVANPSMSTEKIREILNKHPFVGSARIIIIGEDLARSGINEALDVFQRFYQYRRTIYLLLAKGDARDVLETQLRTGQLPALSLLGTMQGQPGTSTFPITRLGHYFTILGRESQTPLIPVVEKRKPGEEGISYSAKEGKEVHVGGAGVFKDGKLIDFLNEEETKGYLWLDNEMKNGFIETKGEDGGINASAWILKNSAKFRFTSQDGNMGVTFQIKATVSVNDIKGQKGQRDPQEWVEFLKEIEPMFAQAIEKECRDAVAKSRGLKADFIGIGRKLEQKDPKYWKEVKEDWDNQFPNFPVSYDIQVVVQNTGLPRNSPVSPQSSEQE